MLIKQHLPDDLLDRHPVGTGHRWRLLSSSNPSASPPMMSAGVAGTGSRAQGQQTGNQQGTQGAPNALRAPAPTDPSPETGPTRFHPTASYTKPRDVTRTHSASAAASSSSVRFADAPGASKLRHTGLPAQHRQTLLSGRSE